MTDSLTGCVKTVVDQNKTLSSFAKEAMMPFIASIVITANQTTQASLYDRLGQLFTDNIGRCELKVAITEWFAQ
jgi:hypothetical protein